MNYRRLYIQNTKIFITVVTSKRRHILIKNIEVLRKAFKDAKVKIKFDIDAIVNPANSGGLGCFTPGHNCVDNRIHTLSGVQLRLECNEVMKDLNRLETGQAFVTHSFNLPCEYIIHTAGPVIYDNEIDEEDDEKLSDSYWNSLNLALDYGMKTIAFPCISTGVSQFPNDRAEKIALKTIKRFLSKYNDLIELIVIVAFKPDDFELYYKDLK